VTGGPDVDQSFATGTSGDGFFYHGGSERNRLLLWQCYTNIIKPLDRSLFHPVVFELKPPLPFLGVVKQHILESAKGSLTIYGHLKQLGKMPISIVAMKSAISS